MAGFVRSLKTLDWDRVLFVCLFENCGAGCFCFAFVFQNCGGFVQALSTARNFFRVLISTFLVHSPSLFSKSSPYSIATLDLANAVYRAGLRNKIVTMLIFT